MAGEICSMRHTKHEHQRWWHVCHRLRPSRPTNEFFVFAVEKGPPRKCSQFSRADRFSRCRLHAGIYEPIVNDLGIARGIVKRAITIGQAARLGIPDANRYQWTSLRSSSFSPAPSPLSEKKVSEFCGNARVPPTRSLPKDPRVLIPLPLTTPDLIRVMGFFCF
jgi:hypothetical protein